MHMSLRVLLHVPKCRVSCCFCCSTKRHTGNANATDTTHSTMQHNATGMHGRTHKHTATQCSNAPMRPWGLRDFHKVLALGSAGPK